MIIVLILTLLPELRLLIPNEKGKKLMPYSLNNSELTFTDSALFIITGVISVAGTALGGIMVSALFRPMFITRYLFPVSVIAWLLVGICISKLKYKSIYSTLIVALICACGIPEYNKIYHWESYQNKQMTYTLEMTQDI